MSTPINSIIFPGSPEKYLLRDHRATTSESGAANINEFGFIKVGYQGNTQNVPVTLDENGNAYVELSNTINSLPTSDVSYLQGNNRWLIFDFSNENRRGLKVKKGTKVKLTIKSDDPEIEDEIRWLNAEEDLHYDFSDAIENFDTLYGANGTDFYVYLVPDENDGVDLVISMDSEYPSDVENENVTYTANNTRKIGQFHTLCVDVGDNVTGIVSTEKTTTDEYFNLQNYDEDKEPDFYNFYHRKIKAIELGTYYNVATLDHPLSGYIAGDILPESVWCLNFHPSCKNWDGMVFCNSCKIAVDIYLQSGTGSATKSEYGAVPVLMKYFLNCISDAEQAGKKMLEIPIFQSAALGSNETERMEEPDAITGGHSINGRRMISFIGCEDCNGFLSQIVLAGLTAGRVPATDEPIFADGQGAFGSQQVFYTAGVGGSFNANPLAGDIAGTRYVFDYDGGWNLAPSNCGSRFISDIATII